MKTVPFVHVRNITTNEHFDIPFDLYNHKKSMCKTDPDFYQWESNEITVPRQVPDNFRSVSDMTQNMYDPTFYQVDADAPEVEAVVEAPKDLSAKETRFAELKTKGFVNLDKRGKEEYKALKNELGL